MDAWRKTLLHRLRQYCFHRRSREPLGTHATSGVTRRGRSPEEMATVPQVQFPADPGICWRAHLVGNLSQKKPTAPPSDPGPSAGWKPSGPRAGVPYGNPCGYLFPSPRLWKETPRTKDPKTANDAPASLVRPDLARPKGKDSRAGGCGPRSKPRHLLATDGDLSLSGGHFFPFRAFNETIYRQFRAILRPPDEGNWPASLLMSG